MTKKSKLEQFDTVAQERDLLQRYFWDNCAGVEPAITATYRTKDNDYFRAFVYAPDRADGGYIVITSVPAGTPSIAYYETWQQNVSELPFVGEWSLAMKSLAEQLRHKLYHASLYNASQEITL